MFAFAVIVLFPVVVKLCSMMTSIVSVALMLSMLFAHIVSAVSLVSRLHVAVLFETKASSMVNSKTPMVVLLLSLTRFSTSSSTIVNDSVLCCELVPALAFAIVLNTPKVVYCFSTRTTSSSVPLRLTLLADVMFSSPVSKRQLTFGMIDKRLF